MNKIIIPMEYQKKLISLTIDINILKFLEINKKIKFYHIDKERLYDGRYTIIEVSNFIFKIDNIYKTISILYKFKDGRTYTNIDISNNTGSYLSKIIEKIIDDLYESVSIEKLNEDIMDNINKK